MPARIGGVVTKIAVHRQSAGQDRRPARRAGFCAGAGAPGRSRGERVRGRSPGGRCRRHRARQPKPTPSATSRSRTPRSITASVGAASSSDQIKEAAAQLESAQTSLAQAQIDSDRAKRLFGTRRDLPGRVRSRGHSAESGPIGGGRGSGSADLDQELGRASAEPRGRSQGQSQDLQRRRHADPAGSSARQGRPRAGRDGQGRA